MKKKKKIPSILEDCELIAEDKLKQKKNEIKQLGTEA